MINVLRKYPFTISIVLILFFYILEITGYFSVTRSVNENSALVASLTALAIAIGLGKILEPIIIYPEFEIADKLKRNSQPNNFYWRIAIKNIGNKIAKDVEVNVTNIYENGAYRKNFLPIPLRWTHLNSFTRNILPNQTVYLDTLIDCLIVSPSLMLGADIGRGVDDFSKLLVSEKVTTLELTIYEATGIRKVLSIEIAFLLDHEVDVRIKGKEWLLNLYNIHGDTIGFKSTV